MWVPDTATDVIFQLPLTVASSMSLGCMLRFSMWISAEMAEDFLPTEQSCEQPREKKKSVSKSRRAVAHR